MRSDVLVGGSKIISSGVTVFTQLANRARCAWEQSSGRATIGQAARHCNQIYISANELVGKSDMRCEVVGPIEAELCYSSLFSHPNMVKRFKTWRSNNR